MKYFIIGSILLLSSCTKEFKPCYKCICSDGKAPKNYYKKVITICDDDKRYDSIWSPEIFKIDSFYYQCQKSI